MTSTSQNHNALIPHINVKLSLLGCAAVASADASGVHEIVSTLVAQYREKERLLANHLCPADQRIQTFLYDYLQDVPVAKLPLRTLMLDRPGMARALSLPVDRDDFSSDILNSYRVNQGVLHNPRSDRRTTQGIFHVAEGGLPDSRRQDRRAEGRVRQNAWLRVQSAARLDAPAVHGHPAAAGGVFRFAAAASARLSRRCRASRRTKTMEIRFFAPGNLVSNLDFVESIFGNGGDPDLPENDAGLDAEHWTGHTGCVILAPHLTKITKKDARPAALGPGHRTPAPRRHVLEGRMGTLQRRPAPSN